MTKLIVRITVAMLMVTALLIACSSDRTEVSTSNRVDSDNSDSLPEGDVKPVDGEAVSSDETTPVVVDAQIEAVGEVATVEAEIAEVLDTFPIRLLVDTDQGRIDVALSEVSEITGADGRALGQDDLRPGQVVKLNGTLVASSMTVYEVTVLG